MVCNLTLKYEICNVLHTHTEGVRTLQDCLTINVNALGASLDGKTEASLRKALSSLDFRFWLEKWDISNHKIPGEKIYASRSALCSMSTGEVNEVLSV